MQGYLGERDITQYHWLWWMELRYTVATKNKKITKVVHCLDQVRSNSFWPKHLTDICDHLTEQLYELQRIGTPRLANTEQNNADEDSHKGNFQLLASNLPFRKMESPVN